MRGRRFRESQRKSASPLRATSCASHSPCAAGPACTPAAAFGPAEPSRPGLRPPLRRPVPERSHGARAPHTLPERSPLPATAADPHGEWPAGSQGRAPRDGGARGNSGSRGAGWGGWRAKRRLMGRRPVERVELLEWGKVARKRFATWAPRSRGEEKGVIRRCNQRRQTETQTPAAAAHPKPWPLGTSGERGSSVPLPFPGKARSATASVPRSGHG